jgi:hypothetical protein
MNNSSPRLKILFALFVTILILLACAGIQSLGTLQVSGEAAIFTLRGEVAHIWNAKITPGNEYKIVVEPENTTHPISQVYILVEADAGNWIGTEVSYTENTAETTFVGPDDGSVIIYVSSKIGENQSNEGTFTIQLQQIEK